MKSWFSNVTFDKLMHIAVCFALVCIITIVEIGCGCSHFISTLIGFLVAMFVGVLKEFLWDKLLGKGAFDIGDLVADAIGSTIGFLFIFIAVSLGGY